MGRQFEASVVEEEQFRFEPSHGALLLSGSADKTVRLWKHETAELIFTGNEHEGGLNDVCWMGMRGNQFCSASDDKTVVLWDVETRKVLHRLTGHTNYVFSIKSNNRGDMLVSGSYDETIRIWDVRSGTAIREIPAHGDPVTCVDWSPDGLLIVSASYDGLCRVSSSQDGRAVKTIVSDDCAPVSNVQFTPNGRYLLITTLDQRITLRKHDLGGDVKGDVAQMNSFWGDRCGVVKLSPQTSRSWLVSGSEDHDICIWNVQRSKTTAAENGADVAGGVPCFQRIAGRRSADEAGNGHYGAVLCCAAQPEQGLVATGAKGEDSSIKIWSVS